MKPVYDSLVEETVQSIRKIGPDQLFNILFLVSAALMGVVIVWYSMLFKEIEDVTRSLLQTQPEWIFAVSPLAFVASFLLVKKFAPYASGSGIPQVMAATQLTGEEKDKSFLHRLLGMRTALVKIASSLLAVFGGGAIGREGPSLHISSCIFYFFHRFFNRIHSNQNHRQWIITGSAAGLAAAFNTPLGGIVYAVEELGAHYFEKVRIHLLVAILVAGLVAQALVGSYLYIGTPATNPVSLKSFAFIVVMSGLLGFFGALISEGLFQAVSARAKIQGQWRNIFVVVGCALVVAFTAFADSSSIGSGKEYINQLLFKPEHLTAWTPLLRIINNFFAYLAGVAGGVFAPSLAAGAGIAYYLNQLLSPWLGLENLNIVMICGMISFLTGVTRTPLTSFILVLEMTDKHASISSMMLSALVSYFAAKSFFPKGFYQKNMEKILESHPPGPVQNN